MSEATLTALDAAIHNHYRDLRDTAHADGEVVISWLVLAATRDHTDSGCVLLMPSGTGIPTWQVKGMLIDALDTARATEEEPP